LSGLCQARLFLFLREIDCSDEWRTGSTKIWTSFRVARSDFVRLVQADAGSRNPSALPRDQVRRSRRGCRHFQPASPYSGRDLAFPALGAPTVISGFDDVAVMGQAIEQCGRHLGVREDVGHSPSARLTERRQNSILMTSPGRAPSNARPAGTRRSESSAT
jgi:hypothetical protein